MLLHGFSLSGQQAGRNEPALFSPLFENIAVEQGLSNHNVSSICQDSLGYLWIGTARGLNRYDGSNFKQYLFSPDAPETGIPYDFIESSLHCNNHIFINTRRGSAALNLSTGSWQSISAAIPISDMIAVGNKVFMIMQQMIFEYDFNEKRLKKSDFLEGIEVALFIRSDDGNLWMLSDNRKTAYHLNLETGIAIASPLGFLEAVSLPCHAIYENRLFLSCETGLYIMDISQNGEIKPSESLFFEEFRERSSLSFFISHERWDRSTVLLGSLEEGLHAFDLRHETLRKVSKEETGLSSDLIKKLFRDRDGNLWVGTFDKGIEVFYQKENPFNFDRKLNLLTENEFTNCIVWNPRASCLLMGTRTKGITSLKRDINDRLNRLLQKEGISNVISLFLDSEDKIWIGSYDKLLIIDQNNWKIIYPDNYLDMNHIQSISEKDGTVYLVANDGFHTYNLQGKKEEKYLSGISGCNQMLHLRDRSILCSELSGLYAFNRETGNTEYLGLRKSGKTFTWEGAVCMQSESDSVIWVGTLSWGLIRVNLNSLECTNYTSSNGLPGNDVTAIEFDNRNRMWMSTSDGISCMYTLGKFNNFYFHEGIVNYQFHRRSSYYDSNGILYFGGNNGVSYFDPEDIHLNQKLERTVLFRDLSVNDNRVEVDDGSKLLLSALPFTKRLEFGHRVSNFAIDFSVIEFFAHDQILYSHRLDGWDSRWQLPMRSQQVKYSNLPPGSYKLMVRAKRSSGEWSDISSLDIQINPAPWFTWWAYSLYILIFAMVSYLIFSLRFRNKLIASNLEIQSRERAREKEINEMKLRFFTNISHEFRTPLSVINSAAYLISKQVEFEGNAKELFSTLTLNTDRLIRLINQLLTFRELESDTLRLTVAHERIDKIIEQACKSLSTHARVKNITLVNNFSSPLGEILCDADKVEKVLSNLISNAIKYTHEGGLISVRGKKITMQEAESYYPKLSKRSYPISGSGYLELTVRDNGRGIKEKDLSRVFKRYSKTDKASAKTDYSSSGIGLNFVKRLVHVHKGEIRVVSTYQEGSEFNFILPLEEKVHAEDMKLEAASFTQEPDPSEAEPQMKKAILSQGHEQVADSSYKIAVVEDDADLCRVLENTLSSRYKVCVAHNGLEGLELVRKEKPDLVISDIMMPEMDGYDLCQEIKTDESLDHIIVFLLSARSEIRDQIEGISKGADLYIPKPFNLDYLLVVINNQIRNRNRIHNAYLKGKMPELNGTQANQEVIDFLSRFNAILVKEISDVELSVDRLADKMNMGRSSFYKKFTSVTRISPNVYIARYRLNKAEELLRDSRNTISDVSEMCGFRTSNYFATLFKKEKGVTPREFRKNL